MTIEVKIQVGQVVKINLESTGKHYQENKFSTAKTYMGNGKYGIIQEIIDTEMVLVLVIDANGKQLLPYLCTELLIPQFIYLTGCYRLETFEKIFKHFDNYDDLNRAILGFLNDVTDSTATATSN